MKRPGSTNASVSFSSADLEQAIPDRFEKIVRQFPDRVAVKTPDQVVTYRELNAQATRVARAILAKRGHRAEPVALLFENGVALTAAMLGVLKAGKFFVLVDPTYPAARCDVILKDIQGELAITDRENILSTSIEKSGYQRLQYADLREIDASRLRHNICPGDLATIVYTSGSTGEPKGVVWDHRDLLHRIMLRTDENQTTEDDRIALLSSSAANTVTNVFLALLNGATLLPFDVQREGAIRLAQWISAEQVSICAISTPLFRKLCESLAGVEAFPSLRIIRLRSDTVQRGDVTLYKKLFPPHCALITGLSTSESGQLTTYVIDHASEIIGNDVPVGYPVSDKEILLLDDAGREVGIDQIGEIVVRSRCLSLGYWGRPDLSESKFRPDPNDPTRRVYHTGDLGLKRSDGCFFHKGRKDFRVKIRGYGVEIAEVEKVLLGHSSVREGVVVARTNDCGEARLVGYFTPRREIVPTVSEMRKFMRATLPEYMIPAAFVKLDSLPLTPNGKVDRRSLPDPEKCRPEVDTPLVLPLSKTEKALTQIWSEVLDVDPVGMHDNFFDLGGDSLLASRLVSRLFQTFQIEVPVSQIFERPTISGIASLVEATSHTSIATVEPPLRAVSRSSSSPLSFAQQRLWFLDQLSPNDCAYNLLSAFRIAGAIDISALERSLNEIIARHEALRTVFDAVDGQPYQKVLPSSTIPLPVFDLGHIECSMERDAEIRRRCAAEARRPFDLTHGPLLRTCLLRQSDDTHLLLVTVHHIVFDGWSMGVLCRELSTFYEAFASGSAVSLPVPAVQYADYAQWQRAWLQGDVLQEDLDYWRSRLDGITPQELPTDRPRPLTQSHRGANKFFTLSSELSSKLKKLSAGCEASLFMTLLAVFKILLHRYTGQSDIVVGCPVAGRSRKEVEDLIGFFLNMLVLRSDTSGDPTFREFLRRVRKICLDAYARQDVPFEKVVEELHPRRDLSRDPLVQTTFAFQNTPHVPLALSGATVSRLEVDAGIARFDLHLFMEQEDERLRGYFSYDNDLFNGDSIDRMAGHFINLLDAVVANPDRRISLMPLMTDAEQQKVVIEWNATDDEYSRDKCIHELFEAQTDENPDAVALIFEDQRLTYRELNYRANQLARYLRDRGVGPETLVAISLRRSIKMVVGLLGILKAGGAYVPLDPAYPKERISFILRDANASVLLTEECLMNDLVCYPSLNNHERKESSCGTSSTHDFQLKVICLDRDREEIGEESGENVQGPATTENLAYVIYTSGSTGFPKGVMIEHRNATAFLDWAHGVFTREDFAGVVASTSICFDLSVFEIFAPLTAGGSVILVENALALAHLDSAVAPTLVNTVPSVMAELLRLGELPTSIRTVNLAGEPLKASLVQQIYQETSARQVYDLFGPSETTTYSIYTHRTGDGVQTIGRPIANTQVFILDSYKNPTPIGVSGEIYIGGAGVARGYLNRPELTAEKFITHSFDGGAAQRLYRTGDLARYLPDGNIEFIGRMDNQIKIRGFRIELGEIEAVLNQHPKVRDAVVLAREDCPGGKRLVAYVVGHDHEEMQSDALKQFLKTKLPDYMVPSAWVNLVSLPHMPNGKIARAALPAPDAGPLDANVRFAAPRTEVEKTLARIWAEVLKLERVGIQDNFFDLGGHSLLATQVISRVRNAFNIEIPLRTLFESPTIEQMAALIMEHQGKRLAGDEIECVLDPLESLSEEEAKRHLVEKTTSTSGGARHE
jgi:amino acid adenylation domain-containing protein